MLYSRPPSVEVYLEDPFSSECKSIVVPVFQAGGGVDVDSVKFFDRNGQLKGAVELGVFKASVGEVYRSVVDGKLVTYSGVGSRDGDYYQVLENVRRGVAAGLKSAVESFQCTLLSLKGLDSKAALEALVAALLASYRFEAFSGEKKRVLERVLVDRDDIHVGFAAAVAEGVYLARDVANAPPHELTPSKLSETVGTLFSSFRNVEVEVFDYERLVREGFGGIVSVGMGSEEKPRLIVVKYVGAEGKPLALVGKTVVFDSGGVNLKTGESIFYMRADKAGGAAVLGALWAAARLNLKVNLVGLLPAVINVPSGSSYLPSDIIKMWDGTRVEITNTDAEGRLIVGDAIAYAAKALDASEIVNLATLTGAIVIALGPLIAGVFTRDDKLREELLYSSRSTGEKLWPMPMEDDYKAWLTQKTVGDIANSGTRAGGAIYGALFLERFSHGKPFAHLDIAGPGMGSEAGQIAPPYWPDKGLAPGFGVRLLVDYIARRVWGST